MSAGWTGPDDPAALPPVGAVRLIEETDAGARFETDAGPLTVEAFAPDVLRLRLGPPPPTDYGILRAAPLPPPDTRIEATAEGWRLTAGRLALDIEADPLAIALDRDGQSLTGSATDRHFARRFRLPPFARLADRDGWFAALDLLSAEPVHGLGEKFGPLDKRGQRIVSRNEDALGVNAEIAYKNTPFAWSPRGWGVFVHTPATVVHGAGFAPWSHRAYGLALDDPALDLFLIAGDDPAAILARYTDLTGRAPAMPRWSLGVWLSKAYYRDPADALAAAEGMRARGLACDVLTLDGRAWLDVETRFAFEWDEGRWAGRADFIRRVKELGYRLCVWEYPYLSERSPHHADWAAAGRFLKDASGAPYRYEWDLSPFGEVLTPLPTSGLVDFTDEATAAFWRDAHAGLFAEGVDVIKSDFGEQIPDDAVAANGDTGRRLHNVYPLLYNRVVFEATRRHGLPGAPMVFARSGWAGSQAVPIQWGGDPQTDWEGLAASIRGGLSWQMSGAAGYATDIGGFYGPAPSEELFVRWMQAAVFCSHMRFHGIGAREPFAFGEAVEAIARDVLALRMRLIPYIEGCLAEASATGLPVQRAMPLAFPDDRAARSFDTQYLFGPAMLVCPILAPGGRVEAWLPAGAWVDFFTGERFEGPAATTFEAPLDRLPVLVAEGWAIPLGPAVAHTGEIPEDGRVDEVRVFGEPRHIAPVPGLDLAIGPDGAVRGLPEGARLTRM